MRGLSRPKRHFASGLGFVLACDAHEREPEAGNALQMPLQVRLVSEQPDDGCPSLRALETHTFEHRCIPWAQFTLDDEAVAGTAHGRTLTADGASACSKHAHHPGDLSPSRRPRAVARATAVSREVAPSLR